MRTKKGNVRLSANRATATRGRERESERERIAERKKVISQTRRLTGIVILSISEILEKKKGIKMTDIE